MSVLEKIRSRAGLLVGVIGVALLVFILQSAFESGNFFFGGGDSTVGVIAGKEIDIRDFSAKVNEAVEIRKQRMGESSLDNEMMDQIAQDVWNQLINEEVMEKEYKKLGIRVSDDELYDIMIEHPNSTVIQAMTNPQTGQVNPAFADPLTGQVSSQKIKEYTQKMEGQDETEWINFEEQVRKIRVGEKYFNLIKKGLYITNKEAEAAYNMQYRTANIKYVIKNYKTVADSTIAVTDAELEKYYNQHQNDFKQEASRKLEYISYDISPSEEDFELVKKDMEKIAEEFKQARSYEDDSLFVVAEADSRTLDVSYHTSGTLSPEIDTIIFKAEKGTVVGPYLENGVFKISKLMNIKTSADSAKVRHILIAYEGSGASQEVKRTKEEAKKMADSLQGLLKKGASFTDFVEKFSDDGGKKMPPDKKEGDDYTGKGGNYGWLNANSGFVEPFKNAGLDGKKGDLVVVESQFGYHIIEVLDSKGSQKKVQVATIDKKVEPSAKTLQAIYAQARDFSGKNNTNELFQKAVVDQKLNKRIAESVKESDRSVSGLTNSRPLVKWIYENELGIVSEPMEYSNKFIVAVITEVNEKGVAPLEKVKEDVKAKVVQEKKAQKFVEEFNAALTAGTTVDALASKFGLSIEQAKDVNFNTYSIPGSNSEPAVIGAVSAMKDKTMSKPIVGNEGVFVVYVESVNAVPAPKDYKEQQKTQTTTLQSRVDYEVYNALKEKANVEEHLVKFGY